MLIRSMRNSARNAHSDMLEKVELESWPVEFLYKLQRSRKISHFIISCLFLIQHKFIIPRHSSIQKGEA